MHMTRIYPQPPKGGYQGTQILLTPNPKEDY